MQVTEGAPTWRHEPEFWSATKAEHAIVGKYELVAFDLPPHGPTPRIIGWEVFTGSKFYDQVAKGDAESFDNAKTAAEAAWRALIAN